MSIGTKKNRDRPILAVTMGDPAGIGPEIVLKALANPDVQSLCIPIVYGDVEWMRQTSRTLGLPFQIVSGGAPEGMLPAWPTAETVICVHQATGADLSDLALGCVSAQAGRAAAESVLSAAEAAVCGEVAAIVTAPLNKEAMALGGFPFPGHTELLAQFTHVADYGMLLLSGPLRVIHVSTHVSLREAIDRVRAPRILECIVLADSACRMLGVREPRIAVAGLNPHAGENGLFGTEDQMEILPAVQEARARKHNVWGPLPADTVFARATQGEFDVVIAMYHDQGHIPVKLHGFDTGVNVTVGLPILRTSVDHGTAFDIAGKGVASEKSLLEAIRVAVQMVHAKG